MQAKQVTDIYSNLRDLNRLANLAFELTAPVTSQEDEQSNTADDRFGVPAHVICQEEEHANAVTRKEFKQGNTVDELEKTAAIEHTQNITATNCHVEEKPSKHREEETRTPLYAAKIAQSTEKE